MSLKLSLTVNFGEEDESLLSFLQNLPQAQWEGLIKEALRVYVASLSPKPAQRSIEDLLVDTPNSLPNLSPSPPNPLNHLWALLGEEEDDEVLELLLHKNNNKPDRFSDLSPAKILEEDCVEGQKEPPMKESEEPSMKNPDVLPAKGLAFVLNQVIGEEDDPEVLSFFANR